MCGPEHCWHDFERVRKDGEMILEQRCCHGDGIRLVLLVPERQYGHGIHGVQWAMSHELLRKDLQ